MTAILEAATRECNQRNINTPEVGEALDSLEPYIRHLGHGAERELGPSPSFFPLFPARCG
jgi:hypothetical protein